MRRALAAAALALPMSRPALAADTMRLFTAKFAPVRR
jgi:hypothetical protein